MRQSVIDWSTESVGLMQFHPTLAALDARLKSESGRGGQLNFHNVSYVGASWKCMDDHYSQPYLLSPMIP